MRSLASLLLSKCSSVHAPAHLHMIGGALLLEQHTRNYQNIIDAPEKSSLVDHLDITAPVNP